MCMGGFPITVESSSIGSLTFSNSSSGIKVDHVFKKQSNDFVQNGIAGYACGKPANGITLSTTETSAEGFAFQLKCIDGTAATPCNTAGSIAVASMTVTPYTTTLNFASNAYTLAAGTAGTVFTSLTSLDTSSTNTWTTSQTFATATATTMKLPTAGTENLRCYFKDDVGAANGIDFTAAINDLSSFTLATKASAYGVSAIFGTFAALASLLLQ